MPKIQLNNVLSSVEITIVICTHNRVELLRHVLDSLCIAVRPSLKVNILIVANACSDGTVEFLSVFVEEIKSLTGYSLRWVEVPRPGKVFALNHAIGLLKPGMIVAFVDDDHRVDANYLVSIEKAIIGHPEITMFCGRILPDWDGCEPAWAHEEGEFAIYPLPVPRYDQGPQEKEITLEKGPLAGGGNLVIRSEVFERVGFFSEELGPKGHDLGGGEDSEFVTRALQAGEVLRYVPDILQYHYVDIERFTVWYVLRKSYQRSRSVTQIRGVQSGIVPKYLWRKLFSYMWWVLVSLYWPKSRFYLVRSAATLGEISGHFAAWRQSMGSGGRQ